MASGDSTIAVHRALIAAIKGDAPLTALIGARVVDWPTEKTAYPCVSVGDATRLPFDTDSSVGSELIVTVHAWAKGSDARPKVREVGEALANLLHRNKAALSIEGHAVVSLRLTSGQVVREDANGELQSSIAHGIYTFRIFTEGTTANPPTA